MRLWTVLIVGMVLGCSSSSNNLPANTPVQTHLALTAFKSCDGLNKYIQDTAVLDMRSQLEWFRNGPRFYPVAADDGTTAGAQLPAAAGPSQVSTTNTQVAGVDEADFVKNDGTRIFVLSGQTLYANQSWPAESLAQTGKLDIEGWPREMFLDGNKLLVFSSVYWSLPYDPSGGDCGWMFLCGYNFGNVTKLTTVDVSDLAHPAATSELYLPGWYNTSRKVGSTARVVMNDSFHYPPKVQLYPSFTQNIWNDPAALSSALGQLEDANEKIIRAAPLTDWIPHGKRKLSDGTLVDVGYSCSDFVTTNAPARMGLVTVASVDMSAPDQAPGRTTLLADPGIVYASSQALYLAEQHWWWWPEDGQLNTTYIHKFNLSDASHVTYAGSGVVNGYVLNQFSLDEGADGALRVASTTGKRVVTDRKVNPWGTVQYSNKVTVLAPSNGELLKVGESAEISPGESLYAARFVGNKGFLTTFHQVDPFITLDLSNNAHPRVVGSLQVPGFSTYLQAVDDNHILAVGIESTDGSGNVWSNATLRVSLFDVSNLASPQRTSSLAVGTSSSWSDALYDHHAFNYFAAEKLLALPYTDWSMDASGDNYWGSFHSSLKLLHVDTTQGLSSVGELSLSDVYQSFSDSDWTWYWLPEVQRSVIADQYVYAISSAGIRVADQAALTTPLATARFAPAKQ